MKRKFNYLLFYFSIFIFLLTIDITVNATTDNNTVNSIDIDVYIDKYGNAEFTEVWDTSSTSKTEWYRKLSKSDNSKITDFSVGDETGKVYQYVSYWNVSAGFEEKAFKNGIHYTNKEVELCWGKSEYGNKVYTIKYKISNLVNQYTDTQGIYWNFLNLDKDVGKVKITIHCDKLFSLDNARIWAFGNNGTINFENGNIVLDSGGYLSSSQYMVALIRFESNIFKSSNKIKKSFNTVYNEAFGIYESTYSTFESIVYGVLSIASIIFIIFFFKKIRGPSISIRRLYFGKHGKSLPSDSKVNYYREIPCDSDLQRAYWVCSEYNLISEKKLKQGIIGAYLLKWVKDDYIKISKGKKKFLNFRDNNYVIDFTKEIIIDNKVENDLYTIFAAASGTDRILKISEFKKYCKKNYSEFHSWFWSVSFYGKWDLEKQGFITKKTIEEKGIFGTKKNVTLEIVGNQLREDAINLKGLKKFLLNFSNMSQREYVEVHIWEEYLIFAHLLGIADKVEEQFSKLYPSIKSEFQSNMSGVNMAVINVSRDCYKSVQTGERRSSYGGLYGSSMSDRYSGHDRDSGGGGSSYSSGGSSAGGSSGGGDR